MSNELERLKTTCIAQEAEIARLHNGFDALIEWAKLEHENCLNGDHSEYQHGGYVMSGLFIENINRITGAEK